MSAPIHVVSNGNAPGIPVKVYVVSSRRSQNVPAMEKHLELIPHTWLVPAGQKEDYLYTGAPRVVECASTQLAHQLNFAIRAGGDAYVVCLDDDLRKLEWAFPGQKATRIGMDVAITNLVQACEALDAYYSGVAPTNNAYFTHDTYKTDAFIRSAMSCYRPGSGLLYDDRLKVKGDYDMTCQHLAKFGRVARVDSLLATFDYSAGSGGVMDYRTDEVIQASIDMLMEKWPGVFTLNVKRPGEVLMKWANRQAQEVGMGL